MLLTCSGTLDEHWWRARGGEATMQSYSQQGIPASNLEWMHNLPLVIEDQFRIYVHGGLDEFVPLAEQKEQILLWKIFPDGYSGEYFDKHLVHGHTRNELNPRTFGNRTAVDSGATYGAPLSAVVFDDTIAGGPIAILKSQVFATLPV